MAARTAGIDRNEEIASLSPCVYAVHGRVYMVVCRVYVRLSDTSRYCTEMGKRRMIQIMPMDSSFLPPKISK